jgi:hypothetical protein
MAKAALAQEDGGVLKGVIFGDGDDITNHNIFD